MSRHEQVCSSTEKRVSFLILMVLAAAALGILLKQRSFNPAVLVALNSQPQGFARAAEPGALSIPPQLMVFGPAEAFGPENLYDKINGKAELYVAAGFVRMHCQRFALKENPEQWLEWFVYDMGTVPQAFSVFSTQRRIEGEPLELTGHAYKTKNALFFVHGSSYVEAIASSAEQALMDALMEMATAFVGAGSTGGGQMSEMAAFPAEHLVEGSQAMQASDAFGFDQFRNVFTARYDWNGKEAMAFVTTCPDVATADALRDAYRAFLLANGGREAGAAAGELGPTIEIMSSFEIVFSHGRFVAGVHAAASAPAAGELARSLHTRLGTVIP